MTENADPMKTQPDRSFRTMTMPIQASVEFDKDKLLNQFIGTKALSFEEFERDWVIEEYPVEIFSDHDIVSNKWKLRMQQDFHIRPKTREEYQLALEVEHDNHVDRTDEVGVDAHISSGRLAG